jgi:hypothetical protein
VERELKQNEHNEEEERMKERYESMHKLRKTKEWYDDSAVKMGAS